MWFVLGLQGSVVGVLGAEQTWFITVMLGCYALTPVIGHIVNLGNAKRKGFLSIAFLLLILPFLFSLIPEAFVSTLLSPICWYTLAYLAGTKFEDIKLSREKAGVVFAVMCVAFGIRLIASFFWDGTNFYGRIAVEYTQALAAFSIFYIFAYVFREKKPPRVVTFLSEISFENYLYHYMFIVGPLSYLGQPLILV